MTQLQAVCLAPSMTDLPGSPVTWGPAPARLSSPLGKGGASPPPAPHPSLGGGRSPRHRGPGHLPTRPLGQ